MSKANEVTSPTTAGSEVKRVVMRWRCGWCGTPTQEDGTPIAMSEIGLTKDIEKYWGNAEQVNGLCCSAEEEEKHHLMMQEIARDEGY